MGAAALLIGTAISAIGTGFSALSGYANAQNQAALSRQSASYAQKMAQRNQTMANYAADQTRAAGLEQASLIRERARVMWGKQLAGYGASGVDISGSPLEVMGQTMGEYERDAHNTVLNANYNAWKTTMAGDTSLFQGMAEADRYNAEASIYDTRATSSLIAAPMVMGTSILTGYGRYLSATKGGNPFGPAGYGSEMQ